MSNYNVFKKDGLWHTKKQGAQRPSAVSKTQKEAYQKGKKFLQNGSGGDISIHGKKGRVVRKHTINKRDPRKIRG